MRRVQWVLLLNGPLSSPLLGPIDIKWSCPGSSWWCCCSQVPCPWHSSWCPGRELAKMFCIRTSASKTIFGAKADKLVHACNFPLQRILLPLFLSKYQSSHVQISPIRKENFFLVLYCESVMPNLWCTFDVPVYVHAKKISSSSWSW